MKPISLTHGQVTIVDDDDFERLNLVKWFACKRGNVFYAERNIRNDKGKRQTSGMHRHIIDCPHGFQIDHIDGDGLNNRKSNLRIVTQRQNLQNLHIKKTSKYPGVYWHTRSKGWRMHIRIPGRKHQKDVSGFKTEEEAYERYLQELNNITPR
jgi:hypothetical protein